MDPAAIAERFRARPAGVWVLDDAAEVAGFVSIGESRDPDARPGDGELYALYVDPARIGRGDGHALLVAGEAGLRALGFAAATLWVFERNDHARRFYERHGWAPDDRPGDRWRWSWAPSLRMRRTL